MPLKNRLLIIFALFLFGNSVVIAGQASDSASLSKKQAKAIEAIAATPEEHARLECLGFVFQQHHRMPYLTALENAMLPLATSSISTKEKRERAMEVLDRVFLGNKASHLPNQKSGGEQGRLAIARALVNQPPLLLADEPTGTLDSRTGNEIMEVFLQINRQRQTVFMVTHNRENATLADRILENPRCHAGRLCHADCR